MFKQIFLIFIIVSIPLVVYSEVRRQRTTARLRRKGTRVPGTIVSTETRYTDEGSTSKAVFRFETADGVPVDPVTSHKGGPADFHEGQSITVAYDPADPANAVIMESEPQFKRRAFLIGAYAVAATAAVILFWDDTF